MSNYPNALDDDASLYVATDNIQSTLASAVSIGDTSITLASTTGFAANQIATIIDTVSATGRLTVYEHVLVTAVVGSTLTVTRGYAGTTARSHSSGKTVSVLVDAAYQSALKSAVIAIETALGVNMGNVAGVRADLFDFTAQTPGGSLIAGNNAITMTPVPAGVNGSDTGHYLYISNGTGTAEAALITGGTGVAGDASGQIIISCANTHSGAWTVRSATAGIQEAVCSLPTGSSGGGKVIVPAGAYTARAPITVSGSNTWIMGEGRTCSRVTFAHTGDGFIFSTSAAGNGLVCLWINGSDTADMAVTLVDQNTFTARDLYIAQFAHGFDINGSSTFDVYIADVNISYLVASTGVGVLLNGGAGHYMTNVQMAGAGRAPFAGIQINQSGGFYINKCDLIQVGQGLYIAPGNSETVSWGWVSDSSFDSCENYGIRIDPTGTGIVAGMTFTSCWSSTNELSGVLINKAVGAIVDGVQFVAHRSYNNAQNGYFIFPGPVNLIFTDCQAAGNSRGSSGTYHGMVFGAATSKFQVNGGIYGALSNFTDTQGYGIIITGGASDQYTINGPVLAPNVTGGISDGGTGTNRVVKLGAGTITVPTIASAASVDPGFGDEEVYYVTGTTAITTIARPWKGRVITLIFTNALPGGVGTGGNIGRTQAAAQNQSIRLVSDGTTWF